MRADSSRTEVCDASETQTRKTVISEKITCKVNKKLIRRRDRERELFYDDIVHILQNNYITTDPWCINSATDQRGYVLERRFTKFSQITQCNGHYAVQGYSRSLIFVAMETSYMTSY